MATLTGVILHRFKYSDTSLIVKIFTKEQGLISSIARGVRKNKKGGFLYQTGNIIRFEYSKKANNSLYAIKEGTIGIPYFKIQESIVKNMLITFLCEVLLKSLEEEQQEVKLFDFVVSQFILLDRMDSNQQTREFHLLFLIKLTKYLGFYPENNYEEGKSFNLLKGEFSYEAINYDQQTSTAFAQLLNSQESRILIDSKEKRKDVLNLLMKYYKTHQQGMGEIKSLKVFEALA